MKKNLFLRISLLLLVATLASSAVFVGTGTSARYVTEGTVTASGTVAKFDIKVSAATLAKSGNIAALPSYAATIDNLGTLYEAGTGTNAAGNGDGALGPEENAGSVIHVTNAAAGTLIAPGTGGKGCTLTIHNDSEVAVHVWIELGATGFNNPGDRIQFSGNNGTNWRSTVAAALADKGAASGKSAAEPIYIAPGGTSAASLDNFLQWKWPFGSTTGHDDDDTALGVAAATNPATAAKLTIPLKINVVQVD